MIRVARLILGGVFIYMGMIKALHPVEFLKVVRQYGVFEHHLALNFIAALLPWFEVFCGVLLLIGVAVRGSAVALLAMLFPFTGLVFWRAWTLHLAQATPFCAVRFDCGCGTGEVLICGKLVENALLVSLSILVLIRYRDKLPRELDRAGGPAL